MAQILITDACIVSRATKEGRRNFVQATIECSPDEFRALIVRRGFENRVPEHVTSRLVNVSSSGAAQ